MKTKLLKGAAVAGLAGFAIAVALNYLAIPEVHVSHSTGECVRVVNHADTNFTCENQPRRYHHVWVK